jgi:hypothetical protein
MNTETKDAPAVHSRYGIERGFVCMDEAIGWAWRQSALLQGTFSVHNSKDKQIVVFEDGKVILIFS